MSQGEWLGRDGSSGSLFFPIWKWGWQFSPQTRVIKWGKLCKVLGTVWTLSDYKDPGSLKRVIPGDQWHLGRTGFPEDWEWRSYAQKHLGKQWTWGPGCLGHCARDFSESRVPQGLPGASCLEIHWGVLLLSEGMPLNVEWDSRHPMNHGDGRDPLCPPTSYPKRESSHLWMALPLRVFHDLHDEVKWKVQEVHTQACKWGSRSLSEGAFSWVKPFTCWRLNALRPLVR